MENRRQKAQQAWRDKLSKKQCRAAPWWSNTITEGFKRKIKVCQTGKEKSDNDDDNEDELFLTATK